MRKLFAALTALLISVVLFAQMPGQGNRGGMAQQLNGAFYGKVLDSITGKPIEAVSVQLLQNKFDTASKKRKELSMEGCLQEQTASLVSKASP